MVHPTGGSEINQGNGMSGDSPKSGETTQSNIPLGAAVDPSLSSDVFISYASQDTAIANAMVETLERRGITCWIAPRDVVGSSMEIGGPCQTFHMLLGQ